MFSKIYIGQREEKIIVLRAALAMLVTFRRPGYNIVSNKSVSKKSIGQKMNSLIYTRTFFKGISQLVTSKIFNYFFTVLFTHFSLKKNRSFFYFIIHIYVLPYTLLTFDIIIIFPHFFVHYLF